jgi:hypothetical protein
VQPGQLVPNHEQQPGDASGRQTRDVCANRHRGNAYSENAHRNASGRLPEARATVYWLFALESAPRSCEWAADALGWPINRMSPRISELKADGWLVQAGEGQTAGGSKCALYRALTAEERAERGHRG